MIVTLGGCYTLLDLDYLGLSECVLVEGRWTCITDSSSEDLFELFYADDSTDSTAFYDYDWELNDAYHYAYDNTNFLDSDWYDCHFIQDSENDWSIIPLPPNYSNSLSIQDEENDLALLEDRYSQLCPFQLLTFSLLFLLFCLFSLFSWLYCGCSFSGCKARSKKTELSESLLSSSRAAAVDVCDESTSSIIIV